VTGYRTFPVRSHSIHCGWLGPAAGLGLDVASPAGRRRSRPTVPQPQSGHRCLPVRGSALPAHKARLGAAITALSTRDNRNDDQSGGRSNALRATTRDVVGLPESDVAPAQRPSRTSTANGPTQRTQDRQRQMALRAVRAAVTTTLATTLPRQDGASDSREYNAAACRLSTLRRRARSTPRSPERHRERVKRPKARAGWHDPLVHRRRLDSWQRPSIAVSTRGTSRLAALAASAAECGGRAWHPRGYYPAAMVMARASAFA